MLKDLTTGGAIQRGVGGAFDCPCTDDGNDCLDMRAWPTEKHFASWLGLCPDHRISGGKILTRRTRHVINRAATALRLAASTLRHSQSGLGANFCRLCTRLGAPKAITALAHKLAHLVYRMLKYGRQ